MAVFGAIVAGILGLTIAASNNAHLRATFADGLLPFGWANRVGDLIGAIIFGGLAIFAVQFVMESYSFRDRAEVIDIPLWPIQLVFPYAFGSAALKHIIFFMSPDLKPAPAGGG